MEGVLKKVLSKDVEYVFLNKKFIIDIKAIRKLNKFIKENDINIVHAHSTSYVQATILKFFNSNVKVIWHDHNGNRSSNRTYKNTVLKFCSFFFNKILVVNTNLKLWAEKKLFTKNVYCLSNFSVLKEEKQSTVLKGVKGKRIVCLANLRVPKNHILLLRAFKIVSNSKSDWSLHLIGEDFNDAYSKEIKEYIIENELQENVFMYGLKLDVNYILNQCDIGVLTSTSEGLPLALLEYGLAKLAVVATNVGDCNKVISKSNEGLLVSSNDIDALTRSLLFYINSEVERNQAGKMLYGNVTNNFMAKSNLEHLVSIYNKT